MPSASRLNGGDDWRFVFFLLLLLDLWLKTNLGQGFNGFNGFNGFDFFVFEL